MAQQMVRSPIPSKYSSFQLLSMTLAISVPGNAVKALFILTLFGLMENLSFDVQSRSESTVFPADNVHFQQAAQISKALVDGQVDFEAMVNIGSGEWD